MPWNKSDAPKHTKKASTSKQKSTWSKVANKVLKQGGSDSSAIRIANSVVKKAKKK